MTRPYFAYATLFACCAVLGFANNESFADTVNMDYTGLGLNVGSYDIHYFDYNAGAMTSKNGVAAGQMKFNISSSTNPSVPTGNVRLFCSDVYDWIHGSPATYDLVPLASAPFSPPEDPPNGSSSNGMGATNASLVSHLYSKFYAISGDSAQNASAFQLALWELVNEDVTGNGFSLSAEAGDKFYVSSGNAGAIAKANGWLSMVTADYVASLGAGPALLNDYSLIGATLEEFQDMIIIVPVPKAFWVMMLGLPSILLLRRFAMA